MPPDIPHVTRREPDNSPAPASRLPRGGWLAIGFILFVMTLVSIYGNLQKARRDSIEKVTITPATLPTPTPPLAEP